MFMSNTSFEADYVHLYIKSETTFNQFIEQVDPFLLNIDDFSILAKRKKYTVRPGKYRINKGMSNNDIINSLRSNNITVNVIYNNVSDLNDLAGNISNQIEADSISFFNSFKTDFFIEKGFDEKNILSMYIPNSYNFFWNTSAEKFNQRMFEEYTNSGKKITGLKKQIKLDCQK